ncbi:energy-coupling factor transporter transmembrane component T family protein [Clostridium neuense]|uniref:Energy-coupling factor transporter transmembrane component T family protein n=1 Tax=Clostridium neuense TaxID=1728934 RepID=A0ABW8T9W3_9CLOT
MKTLSLYEKKDTAIHKIDPITKVLYIILVIAVPIILPSKIISIVFLFLTLMILCMGKVLKRVVPIIGFSFIVLVSVIVIQGLFRAGNKTELFKLGSLVFYKEGLSYAFEICLRVLNILSSVSILILTTKPSDLIEAFVRRGLSPKIGYVLSSVLQLIPQMTSTMSKITDAQRSRGMETEGNIIVRLKAFLPLIAPATMNSLTSTRERSMALEVRAFDSKVKKTFLNEEEFSYGSKFVRLAIVIIFAAAIIWRIFIWKR